MEWRRKSFTVNDALSNRQRVKKGNISYQNWNNICKKEIGAII
ncbi:hypothetical protein BOVAC1_116 [Bacteroides ovatus]|nr:hypothetical protein BOVAC1_116 [Bacteroides ovatus]